MSGNTILIAPTSFKGTLSAVAASVLMYDILSKALEWDLHHYALRLELCPIADGGDDTLSVMQMAMPELHCEMTEVTGPLAHQKVQAFYGMLPDDELAIVEASQAHGMVKLPRGEHQELLKDPLNTTSYGVGQIVKKLNQLYPDLQTLALTLGGSASTDGGAGALQALGTVFLDKNGTPMTTPMCGGKLADIGCILPPEKRLSALKIIVATDVTNPLLGPTGTAHTYSPQKGSTPEQVALLEEGIAHYAQLMSEAFGVNHRAMPRAGAAGGLAYGLSHLSNVSFVSGFEWLADLLSFWERLNSARLVITGEGRLDQQTLHGKVIGSLIRWSQAQPHPRQIVIFCGQVEQGLELPEWVHVFPLVHSGWGVREAMGHPEEALRETLLQSIPAIRALKGPFSPL